MTETNIDDKVRMLHLKAKTLIENKKGDEDVIAELLKEGIDQNYAITIIDNVKNDFQNKKEFRKHMWMGSFMTVAGLLINYLSYKFAEERGGGMYLIIWGIVVTGIITIIRGVILFK